MNEGQEEILKAIKRSHCNGRLVPFVGAGFSKNIGKKSPDWNEFIESLYSCKNLAKDKKYNKKLAKYNKFYIKKLFPGSNYPLDAAEFYSVIKFRAEQPTGDFKIKEARKYLPEAIYTDLDRYEKIVDSSEPHTLLAKMFPIIYTTNWDKFIEIAMRKKPSLGKFLEVHSLGQIIKLNNYKRMVNKIHGSVTNRRNIIVTTTDYSDLLHNRHNNYPLNVKLQNEIFHKDFLFIGFSFADPNINNIIYPTISLKKKLLKNNPKKPELYMVNFGPFDAALFEYYKEFKDINIYFIDVAKQQKKEATTRFLSELHRDKLEYFCQTLQNTEKKSELIDIMVKEQLLNKIMQREAPEKIEKELEKKSEKIKKEIKELNSKIKKKGLECIKKDIKRIMFEKELTNNNIEMIKNSELGSKIKKKLKKEKVQEKKRLNYLLSKLKARKPEGE